jgi:hypothetical protein
MQDHPELSPSLTSQAIETLKLQDGDCPGIDIKEILAKSNPNNSEVRSEESIIKDAKKFKGSSRRAQ